METKKDIRYEDEYIKLKRAKRKLKRSNQRLARFCFVLMGVIGVLLLTIIIGGSILLTKNYSLENKVAKLETTIDAADTYNLELTNGYNTLSSEYEKVAKLSSSLDDQNKELVDKVNSLNETLTQYEERKELFDEYEYAIIREDGTRTDISYENINNLKSVAKDLDISDEGINLILSTAMTETKGTEDATNPKSTAVGLGQLLSGTGEYVWENLMKEDSKYNHKSVASDADNNLTMMAYYIKYLNDKYNGNAKLVMKEYRGEDDTAYFKRLDKYLDKNDLSLDQLKISERTD